MDLATEICRPAEGDISTAATERKEPSADLRMGAHVVEPRRGTYLNAASIYEPDQASGGKPLQGCAVGALAVGAFRAGLDTSPYDFNFGAVGTTESPFIARYAGLPVTRPPMLDDGITWISEGIDCLPRNIENLFEYGRWSFDQIIAMLEEAGL